MSETPPISQICATAENSFPSSSPPAAVSTIEKSAAADAPPAAPILTRKYNSIISLGLNCELSFNLRRVFGFVDSYPLSWATTDIAHLAGALDNIGGLLAGKVGEFEKVNMWIDVAHNIAFHGAHSPAALLDEAGVKVPEKAAAELEDLRGRTHHLVEKQIALWASGGEQLYIIALHPERIVGKDAQKIAGFICEIKTVLDGKTPAASLLIVAEEALAADLEKLINVFSEGGCVGGIILRKIKHFGPNSKATSVELQDSAGWDAIFAEFQPHEIKTENKTYKFEKETK
jgi:hypothetical protein